MARRIASLAMLAGTMGMLATTALVQAPAQAASLAQTEQAQAAQVTPMMQTHLVWQGQERSYWCGPAAIRMGISAALRTTTPPSQTTIANYVGTTRDGTNRYQMRDGLNHFIGNSAYQVVNVSNPMSTAQVNALWANIKNNVNQGYTVPVNIVTHAGGPRPPGYAAGTNVDHWIVVWGYRTNSSGQNEVLIGDPASGRAGFNPNHAYWMSLWLLKSVITKTYVG